MKNTINYEKFVTNIIDPRQDTYITSIELKNGNLKLGPLAVFEDYKMKNYLTENESSTFNILNNSSQENYFKINCPNDSSKFIVLSTYDKAKSAIEIENDTAKINTKIEVRIVENHCEMNFKETQTYEELEQKLNQKLEHDAQEVIETLIKNNSDILKIRKLYYQKYKKDQDFRLLNYQYEAKTIINRNGLIFEVKK